MSIHELHGFDDVTISDNNESRLPEFKGDGSDSNAMLDYMVLVFSRCFQGELAFKGGYLLNKILQDRSRLTHDIDFSIAKKSSYEQVKEILNQIASVFLKIDIIDDFRIKDDITPTSSGGIDLYKDGVKILGVDVGLHDISYGITTYDFNFITESGFTLERMLADKIIAILSRKRFRRTKDLFDFYVLMTTFDVSYSVLTECIAARGNADWENIPFSEEVLRQYEIAWDKLILTSSITKAQLFKPGFQEVIALFDTVVFPIKYGEVFEQWDHQFKSWR